MSISFKSIPVKPFKISSHKSYLLCFSSLSIKRVLFLSLLSMYYLIFSALYQCLPLLFNLEQCSSNSFMHREGLTVVRLRLLCFCLGCSWQPVLVCGSQEACSSNKQSGDPVWLSVSCVDWVGGCVGELNKERLSRA